MGLFSSIMGFIDTGRASKSISDANIAAEHGVLNATDEGKRAIEGQINLGRNSTQDAFNHATENVNTATGNAVQDITDSTNNANVGLKDLYGQIRGDNAAARTSGDLGNTKLQDYVNSNPQFNFSYDDYKNDDAFKFEQEQARDAIQNRAAAGGLAQGGAVLAALQDRSQGLAATHYNDAFNRAKAKFDTNEGATLANLKTLIDSGSQGNQLTAAAGLNTGDKIADNTVNAGNNRASLNTDAQKFLGGLDVGSQLSLSGQGLAGATALGDLGLKGAKTAGDFATGAGLAHATGITGQGAALDQGVSDLAGLFTNFIPGLGKGTAGKVMGGLFG